MNIEVYLALSAINSARPEDARFAICDDPETGTTSLPYVVLPQGSTTFDAVNDLFVRMTSSFLGRWAPVRQVGMLEGVKEGVIIVLYSCMIPEPIPLKGGGIRWVSFEELMEYPQVAAMIGQSCNYQKAGNI
jgi:hypothetical protein